MYNIRLLIHNWHVNVVDLCGAQFNYPMLLGGSSLMHHILKVHYTTFLRAYKQTKARLLIQEIIVL